MTSLSKPWWVEDVPEGKHLLQKNIRLLKKEKERCEELFNYLTKRCFIRMQKREIVEYGYWYFRYRIKMYSLDEQIKKITRRTWRLKLNLAEYKEPKKQHKQKITDYDIQKAREYPLEELMGLEFKSMGRNRLKTHCPFHEEKTPSFMVFTDENNYHCFGCGEHGNAIDWVMKIEGLSFIDTIKKIISL